MYIISNGCEACSMGLVPVGKTYFIWVDLNNLLLEHRDASRFPELAR